MSRPGMINGQEQDAFSRYARSILSWRAGVIKKAKRAFNKRVRKLAKLELLK